MVRCSAYDVACAFYRLVKRGTIALNSGTRSYARGHFALRIVSTGTVLRTVGCPFNPPDARPAP